MAATWIYLDAVTAMVVSLTGGPLAAKSEITVPILFSVSYKVIWWLAFLSTDIFPAKFIHFKWASNGLLFVLKYSSCFLHIFFLRIHVKFFPDWLR